MKQGVLTPCSKKYCKSRSNWTLTNLSSHFHFLAFTLPDQSLAVKKISRWLDWQDVGMLLVTPLDPLWPLSQVIMWPSPAKCNHQLGREQPQTAVDVTFTTSRDKSARQFSTNEKIHSWFLFFLNQFDGRETPRCDTQMFLGWGKTLNKRTSGRNKLTSESSLAFQKSSLIPSLLLPVANLLLV